MCAAGQLPIASMTDLATKKAASAGTRAWLLYDSHAIYACFQVSQPSTPITATQSQNDVGFGIDDFVGLGLDPTGNGNRVYYFEVNPLGTHFAQSSENARYRPIWTSHATKSAGSWTAFMRIPLRVLRIAGGSPQTWRINIVRFVAATAQRESWAYDGLMSDGLNGPPWPDSDAARFWPSWTGLRFGTLAATARPRPRIAIYGLSSSGSDREQFLQANGLFQQQPVRSMGVDIRVPVTATTNFVATVNPDFSNVEIDQQTISPQEFRRNLQEYRPFFAQGASFINNNPYGSLVFYSPGVGAFDRGAKLEGTFGNQSFGALTFRGFDPTTGNTFDDTAFGFKHALADRTFLLWTNGVLAHHSLAGNDSTVELGVGGRNNRSGFVWALSHDAEHGSWLANGTANATNGFVDIHRTNYEINIGATDISPTYNPLDGFTPVADQRGFTLFSVLNGSPLGIKHASLFLNADRFFDASGAVRQSDFDPALSMQFKNGFSINGLGPTIGTLRSYDIPSGPSCSGASVGSTAFSGYPCYRNGQSQYYNLMAIPIGFRDGTPSPMDASVSWGVFGASYLHQYDLTHTRQLGPLTLTFEYGGTYERSQADGSLDSQWLRRFGLGYNLNRTSSISLGLRSVNGYGGFVPFPGTNISMSYHRRFSRGDLFVNFGTPAASNTLHRLIVKYLFRIGSHSG